MRGVLGVRGANGHPVLEAGAIPRNAITHVGDAKAVLGQQGSDVFFRHRIVPVKADVVVGIRLRGQAGFDQRKADRMPNTSTVARMAGK